MYVGIRQWWCCLSSNQYLTNLQPTHTFSLPFLFPLCFSSQVAFSLCSPYTYKYYFQNFLTYWELSLKQVLHPKMRREKSPMWTGWYRWAKAFVGTLGDKQPSLLLSSWGKMSHDCEDTPCQCFLPLGELLFLCPAVLGNKHCPHFLSSAVFIQRYQDTQFTDC